MNALDLYKDAGMLEKLHIWIKSKITPFELLESYIPRKGKLLDLGCGHGYFANLVALKGRNVVGIDLDKEKVEIAKKTIGKRKNIKFEAKDLKNIKLTNCSAITILDVLYLIPYDKQREILQQCYDKLSKNGILLIRDTDTKPRWKFYKAYLQEFVMVNILRKTAGMKLYFRNSESYREILEKIGFKVEIKKLPSITFQPSVMFVCRKS